MRGPAVLPALALPAALGLAWAALRPPPGVPGLATAPVQGCQASPVQGTGVQVHAAPDGTDLDFYTTGLARLRVCAPGTLGFSASGTPARGQDPALSVALGPRPLLDTHVRAPQTFRLRVDAPGWLSLSFPNDYADAREDRNLFVKGLRFVPDGQTAH